MKAYWYDEAGDAQAVLTSGEMEKPTPGADQVRVRVAYSAVNPFDTKKRVGGGDVQKFGRVIPNCDGSGIIDQVGAGVDQGRIGQKVWIFGAQVFQPFGTAAEYCVVPARHAVPLPENVSLLEGATLGTPAVTAHRAVFCAGDVLGKTLYIAGATGRVGSYALQFAKRAGARVIAATGSTDQVASLKDRGADGVVNYRDPDRAGQVMALSGGRGVDHIVESSFGANMDFDAAILAPHGSLGVFGIDDVGSHTTPHIPLLLKNAQLHYIAIYFLNADIQQATFAHINDLLKAGRIDHHIGNVYAFDGLKDAHEAVQEGAISGAAVVTVSGN